DAVEVDAKLLGDDLAVGGLVTLARRLRADIDVDEAVFGEADFRALGRRAAGRLEIIGHADAAALATLAGLGPARREAGPVDRLQRGIRRVLELAGIVGQAHGAGPWEGVGRDVVPAPQFGRIDLQLTRRGVDQPLHHIVGFRTPGAAIGIHR